MTAAKTERAAARCRGACTQRVHRTRPAAPSPKRREAGASAVDARLRWTLSARLVLERPARWGALRGAARRAAAEGDAERKVAAAHSPAVRVAVAVVRRGGARRERRGHGEGLVVRRVCRERAREAAATLEVEARGGLRHVVPVGRHGRGRADEGSDGEGTHTADRCDGSSRVKVAPDFSAPGPAEL